VSSIIGLMLGLSALVVDVTDDAETGGARVYIDARYLGRYVVIDDPAAADEMRRQWRNASQHLVLDHRPPDDAITTETLRP
jgi:hypothetical protein